MSEKNKKINVMMSIAGLHHGGAERVIATLCRNLDREKFSVSVCWRVSCDAIGEELKAQGFEIIGLPELDPNITPYKRFLVLKKLLKDKRIDIIHTHDTGALADAAQCRLLGSRTRLVHTYHFGNYPHLKKSYIFLEMVFSRIANYLVPVGYEQAKRISNTLHLPLTRLDTIYNGVEIPEPVSADALLKPYREKPGNPVIVGSISTLTEQKGLTYLLDTAAILKARNVNCIFLIAGNGPMREELKHKCEHLGLTDMVYFLGWVANAADKILHSLDIFCQSSLWEGNSIVLLEAMASGLPIVTTEVGESKHVIEEGKSGYVVQPRDIEGMADALTELVLRPQLRQQMGNNARERFKNNYTIDRMIQGYEKVYESLA